MAGETVFSVTDSSSISAAAGILQKSSFELAALNVLWADSIGPLIAAELQHEAPWRTGRLAGSIRYQRQTRAGGVGLQFQSNVPYVPFVINGTAPHDIYPVAAKALHWGTAGGGVFAAYVRHPGTKPNNFPQRVFDKMEPVIVESYAEAIKKAITP